MTRRLAVAVLLGSALAAVAAPDEPVDFAMVSRIRDEGFTNSKVMDTLSQLTDVIGPRLTGSPNMKKADDWAEKKFTSWGIANAHQEAWGPFGRGWSLKRYSARRSTP